MEQKKTSAINIVFIMLMGGSIIFGAFNGRMQEVTNASFQSAKDAVNLAISLIGIMALWLGLIRILEVGGLMRSLASVIKPVMSRLFKDVPAEHPAMSAMVLNMSASILGLGNAATPFGIKAMVELNKLNPVKGVATNAMILFLAINTSAITIFPLGVIGLRTAAGTTRPADVFLPTLIATICSTFVGIFVALWFAKRDKQYLREFKKLRSNSELRLMDKIGKNISTLGEVKIKYLHLQKKVSILNKLIAWILMALLVLAAIVGLYNSEEMSVFLKEQLMSFWLMPFLVMAVICYGIGRGVLVYEAITGGAKQGFYIAVKIIPFLVAILVAIGMFRASGAMDMLVSILSPVTNFIRMPADTLPMALVKPLSGQGAFGIMSSLLQEDPDSHSSFVASVMQGSTETTFYFLAVYFGSIGITKIRHALVAALCADVAGIVMACLASAIFLHI